MKVEDNETALVNTSTGGYCGRYVVVRHDYPSGKSVFTRYAQLGRLIGEGGKPVRAGLLVKRQDKIGEVGKKGLFHFEVRPLDEKNTERAPNWPLVYAGDAAMQWAKFLPVDAEKFDFDAMRSETRK